MAHPSEFANTLANGGDLPPGALAWLQTGFKRFLHDDQGISLEVALHLTGGQRRGARDRLLVQAASIIDGGKGIEKWELAKSLSARLERFSTQLLPRIRTGKAMPATEIDDIFLRIYQIGPRVQLTRESLYNLLKNST
jgi:hypothetical protein